MTRTKDNTTNPNPLRANSTSPGLARAGFLKPIPGYEGRYSASEDGRIWSHISNKWMKFVIANGYPQVGLRVEGFSKTRKVHQLVCATFHGPRPVGHQTRHLNGNRSDNRSVNLAWGTAKENHEDSVRHGTAAVGERAGASKLSTGEVKRIRQASDKLGTSVESLSRQYGISESAIRSIIDRITWRCVE